VLIVTFFSTNRKLYFLIKKYFSLFNPHLFSFVTKTIYLSKIFHGYNTPMETLDNLQLPNHIEQDIEAYGRIFTFSKDEVVFSPEEMLDYFFIVFKGRIKVSHINLKSGKEQILKILTTADMYDVVSLLDGKLHENILTCLDNGTQIMRFPIEIVRKWVTTNTSFNQLFFPYIANQLRHTEELAIDLATLSVPERLLKLIIRHVDPHNPNHLNLIHDLPHEEIAALIGTVRKVLNRHIQTLKEQGVIEVTRKNITLKQNHTTINELKQLEN
jgi:CRP/FNR family cyclic AMP-dependent transcriptional regulator